MPDTNDRWSYWSRMQRIYKRWVATDWKLELAALGRPLYEDFISELDTDGKVILDLGGYWGMNRAWIKDADIYAVLDPDDEEVRLAPNKWLRELYPFYGEPLPFVRGVGEQMPFGDGTLDLVIVQSALDHLLDPRAVLAEVRRTLKPGGTVAILVDVSDAPEIRSPFQDLVYVLRTRGIAGVVRGFTWKIREKLRPGENRHGHIHEFVAADVFSLLEDFQDVRAQEPGPAGFPHRYFIGRR